MIKGPFNTYPIGARPLLTEADLDYQRLAVDQPPGGGSVYPFTWSHALTPLVGDFYLSYYDPGAQFQWPFRLIWLHGFGLGPITPPTGLPSPVHVRECLIADANDVVVFDSTEADGFSDVGWGARRVVSWRLGDAVARVVFYEGKLSEYFVDETYSDAVLDSRTYQRLARRLNAVTVGVDRLRGGLAVKAGYNVRLDVGPAESEDGGRVVSSITIGGVPGAGLGLLPCSEVGPVAIPLVTINRISPDASGRFVIQVGDCYRLERSVTILPTAPYRTASYATPAARGSVILYNDCGPCCECVDYSNTYAGLKATWDDWAQVTAQAMYVRDQFGRNTSRWSDQASCRLNAPVQAILAREPECHVSALARFCNMSPSCLANMVVRFTVQRYTDAVRDTGVYTTSAVDAYLGDADQYSPRSYSGAGGAVYDFIFDGAEPRAASIAKLRLCVPCDSSNSVRVTVTAHATAAGDSAPPPELTVPSDIALLWTALGVDALAPLRGITSVYAPLDPMPASSGPCDCE